MRSLVLKGEQIKIRDYQKRNLDGLETISPGIHARFPKAPHELLAK